jgi:hypothetical protein
MHELAVRHGEKRKGLITLNAFQELYNNNNPAYIYALQKMKRLPCTIEEFIDSPEFMAQQVEIWPDLRDSIIRANPDQLIGQAPVNEYIMGGASSTGKSLRAMISNAYQLYFVNCFDWPQELFKLSRPTEIVFLFLSIKPTTAEKVLYKPFYQYFMNMPYTKKYVHWNQDVKSEIQLEQNITVRYGAANVNSLVGHAIMSGIIDEINFFARVENSKQAPEEGGTFDQAEIVHRTMLNRRKSRFESSGISPGIICISAQTRYKNDFTDRREEQVRKNHETGVIICRKKRYEAWPVDKYSAETFTVLVGTDQYPTRIIEADSKYVLPPGAVLEQVPMNFLSDFKRDPEYALREIVGVATTAITPFIAQRQKIYEATAAWVERGLKPWTSQSNYILNEHSKLNEKGMPVVLPENLPTDGKPRFVHVDLSKSADRCGIAISHIDGYVKVDKESLPYFVTDWVVTLEPDSVNQVDIDEVRRWVADLKLKYKLNIARVSYDGFQSLQSVQMLRKIGINSMELSVDKTTQPYDHFKSALYSNRVALPDIDILRQELAGLEFHATANGGKGKIDHPPVGVGKDAADPVCASLFNITASGNVRAGIGYSDHQSSRPNSLNRPSNGRGVVI